MSNLTAPPSPANGAPLENDACYLAMKTHDARFDGSFFTAVTSTGIYCRPVCKVRTPKRENCRFFGHAAQAEQAGFRPCLRCRPELAPTSLRWSAAGRSRRVRQGTPLAWSVSSGRVDEWMRKRIRRRFGAGTEGRRTALHCTNTDIALEPTRPSSDRNRCHRCTALRDAHACSPLPAHCARVQCLRAAAGAS